MCSGGYLPSVDPDPNTKSVSFLEHDPLTFFLKICSVGTTRIDSIYKNFFVFGLPDLRPKINDYNKSDLATIL